jgi:peptidyl-prolyl cis-trans isomerase SurA
MQTMRRVLSLLMMTSFGLFFITNYTQAQKSKKPKQSTKAATQKNPVVMQIGPETVTFSDLEQAYKRNMNRKNINLSEVKKDSVLDFVRLYTNYRLKVLDAFGRKLDQDSAVKADIEQNRKLLADNYLYEKRIVEPTINQMLQRRKRELQVAIIFVERPADTVKAWQKAQRLLAIVKAGADFERIARDSSEDRETGNKGGLLPYITSGRILRAVEDAAYATPAGQVHPSIIIGRGGYFIVKTIKNESRIKVKASHILCFMSSSADSLNAAAKADSLIALMKGGASFSTLAKENSDDASSKEKYGSLGGWYTRSKGMEGGSGDVLHPSFEAALYALKDGEISGKVWTDYGCHIIRRDSTKEIDLDEDRESLKKEYKRIYFEEDKRRFLDSLKTAFGWSLDMSTLKQLTSMSDTMKIMADTNTFKKITSEIKSLPLYNTKDQGVITVGNFLDSVKKQEFRTITANTLGITRALDKMTDPKALKIATAPLEKEYPEFGTLMREFRDGILLFKVEEQEVWSKLKFDSLSARKYWDTTKIKYKTDVKYDFNEIYVTSDTVAKALRDRLNAGDSFEKLATEFTERAGFKEKKVAMHHFLQKKANWLH